MFRNRVLIRVLVAVCFWMFTEAANVKAHFPLSNSKYFPQIRFTGTSSDLKEFTFCSWIKHNRLLGSIASYTSLNTQNEFHVTSNNFSNVTVVVVRASTGNFTIACNDAETSGKIMTGRWYHLCISWIGMDGTNRVYLNGRKCYEHSLRGHPTIAGGGMWIIGQELKVNQTHFTPYKGFHGDVADVQLWDEALTDDQIKEAGRCGGKRREGNVVRWMKTPMFAIGVVFQQTELCSP